MRRRNFWKWRCRTSWMRVQWIVCWGFIIETLECFAFDLASKKLHRLTGPGRTERWLYWKYRTKEQVWLTLDILKSQKWFLVCLLFKWFYQGMWYIGFVSESHLHQFFNVNTKKTHRAERFFYNRKIVHSLVNSPKYSPMLKITQSNLLVNRYCKKFFCCISRSCVRTHVKNFRNSFK
jgi:hypothetical protein